MDASRAALNLVGTAGPRLLLLLVAVDLLSFGLAVWARRLFDGMVIEYRPWVVRCFVSRAARTPR